MTTCPAWMMTICAAAAPTTHIAFDEMTAVLAGDALLTIAFEILADARTHPSADVRCALIARLAEASGHSGMIGGQIIDMLADQSFRCRGCDRSAAPQDRPAVRILLRGRTDPGPGQAAEDRARLKAYAEDMGVVFQITDDLLDVTSTAEKTGKAVGKDADMGKQTLVTLLGVEGARAEAEKRARRAVEALGPYAARAPELSALAVLFAGSAMLEPDFTFAVFGGPYLGHMRYWGEGDFHESYFEKPVSGPGAGRRPGRFHAARPRPSRPRPPIRRWNRSRAFMTR